VKERRSQCVPPKASPVRSGESDRVASECAESGVGVKLQA